MVNLDFYCLNLWAAISTLQDPRGSFSFLMMKGVQVMQEAIRSRSRSGLARQLINLSGPLVMSNLAYTMLGVADTFFMGKVSTTALGAVGLGNMMFLTVSLLFRGTINGVTPFVARMFGSRDYAKAGRYLQYFLTVCLLLLPFVLLLPVVFSAYLSLMRPDPVVARAALTYVNIRVLEIPFSLIVTAIIGFLVGVNNSRLPMLLAWFTVGVNIVANYVLVFGKLGFPPLGIAGAAWGTVFAVFCQTILGVFLVIRHYSQKFGLLQWKFPKIKQIKSMVKIGLPLGVMDAVELGAFTTFFALLSRLGETELAASQIANQIAAVSFMPGFALSAATGSLVGRYIGAKDFKVAERVGYLGAILGAGTMGIMGVVFWLFANQLGRIFTDVPEVLSLAALLLKLMAFYQVFDGFNIVCRGALNGAGDTRYTMIATMLCAWLIFIPGVYLFTFVFPFGLVGAWCGAGAYLISLGVIFFSRFRSGVWKNIEL